MREEPILTIILVIFGFSIVVCCGIGIIRELKTPSIMSAEEARCTSLYGVYGEDENGVGHCYEHGKGVDLWGG